MASTLPARCFVICGAIQKPCEPHLRINLVQLGGFDQGEGDCHRIAAML